MRKITKILLVYFLVTISPTKLSACEPIMPSEEYFITINSTVPKKETYKAVISKKKLNMGSFAIGTASNVTFADFYLAKIIPTVRENYLLASKSVLVSDCNDNTSTNMLSIRIPRIISNSGIQSFEVWNCKSDLVSNSNNYEGLCNLTYNNPTFPFEDIEIDDLGIPTIIQAASISIVKVRN